MTEGSLASAEYWDARAARYAGQGTGLAAVCSYGMPGFYNACIDVTQRLALRPWLRVAPGDEVLDIGCGVGRWSVEIAARGATVTGVDLSEAMLVEARKRASQAGVAGRCTFIRQDLSVLDTGGAYDLILGVTVLQHIMDAARLREGVRRLAAHLRPGGRLVLLEVAPTRPNGRCDTATFRARPLESYLSLFAAQGLQLEALTGVDPASLRLWFLPYYRSLPRPLAMAGLVAATALCFPVDTVLGRRLVDRSWHKVLVFTQPEKDGRVPTAG